MELMSIFTVLICYMVVFIAILISGLSKLTGVLMVVGQYFMVGSPPQVKSNPTQEVILKVRFSLEVFQKDMIMLFFRKVLPLLDEMGKKLDLLIIIPM